MNAAHPNPEATWQRLQRYATRGCEESFRELFEGHIGLVYHAALRLAQGDQALAEEVAQTVFADLARKAAGFSPKIILPAWLHRHACLTTRQMLRSRRRRRARELAAARLGILRADKTEAEGPRRELSEAIDAALDTLPSADREVLILRFMEGRDFREVGKILGISDDAAQKRATRGLERLRATLARQGFAATVAGAGAALGLPATAIPASALTALTAALPAVISGAGTADLGLSGAGAGAVLFAMKPAVIAATAAVLAVGGLLVIPQLAQRRASPPPVAAVEKTSPPPAGPKAPAPPPPVSLTRKPASGRHFPQVAPSGAASTPSDNEKYKEAFAAHPRTKQAQRRIDFLKGAAKAFLDQLTAEHNAKIKEWLQAELDKDNSTLSDAERAKAASAMSVLKNQVKAMEQEMAEKRNQLTEFLQNMVFSDRTSILAEVKNPSLSAPKTVTEASEAALRAADASFANGDYQAAATALQPVLDTLPDAERGSAQWKVVLGQMIAGQDAAPAVGPMLQGSAEQALYALAAYAIQQGGWDEAQIWLDQAAASGDKAINDSFNQPLIHLGWMDPKTGKLIPPPAAPAKPQ